MNSCSRVQIDPYLLPAQMQLQMDQHETKLTEEKVGNMLLLTGTGKDLLEAQALRPTIDKWELVKANKPLYSKGHHHLGKAAVYRIGKKVYQLSI